MRLVSGRRVRWKLMLLLGLRICWVVMFLRRWVGVSRRRVRRLRIRVVKVLSR